jgi:alpha-beta hydrolase superfamily lysophospholipase
MQERLQIPTASGEACAATLYRPDGVADAAPCVVMGAGGTLTQRDGIPDYAERFAVAGFAALSFDYRHWGDSGGEPRRLISLPRQLEDWRAAVSSARNLEGVDPDRIATWGMSSGGGHALSIGADDPRIAAVIALVPMADGLAFSLGRARLRVTRRNLRTVIRQGTATFSAAGPRGTQALFDEPEALPGFERLAAPNGWRNEVTMDYAGLPALYRPVRQAARIQAPTLVQLGERDAIAPRRAVERTAARAPRGELKRYPIDHFGCFWPERIDEVAGDQIDFLRSHVPSS